MAVRDFPDSYQETLAQQNMDSDYLLELPPELSMAYYLEREAFRYEASRQRYEADAQSVEHTCEAHQEAGQ